MAAQELLAIKEQILSIHQAAELALNDENRDSILGPELMEFYANGTGAAILRLAVSMDALRVVGIVTGHDDVITPEEEEVTKVITVALVNVLGKIRPEYANAQEKSPAELLEQYLKDDGPFGFLCAETTWAAGHTCQRLVVCDESIIETYRDLLVGVADFVKSPDDLDSRRAVAGEIAKVVDLSNTTLAPSGHKYYMDFRPGTGRLEIQRGTDLMIRYSHTGWYGNAHAGIEFHVLEDGQDGISKDGIEIDGDLFQNITAFLQSSMAEAVECLVNNEQVVCKEFDLRDGLGSDSIAWSQANTDHGPIQSASQATQEEWNAALIDNRAISIVRIDDEQYIGIHGDYPDCWSKVIFSSKPSGNWIEGFDDDDVSDEESEEMESQGDATGQLFSAIQNNDIPAAECAFNNGAEIDHQHEEFGGNTPILAAVGSGNAEMVQLIASHGPDFSLTNWEDRQEPWLAARVAGKKEVADILVKHGAEEKLGDALTHAATCGSLDLATAVLDEGADVDGHADSGGYRWGTPPILDATSNGHADVVELLVARGVNIHVDEYGMNPYVAAFSHGFFELAERARELGCTVDEGYALLYSARLAHLPAIEAMIATGIDINSRRERLNDQTTAIEQAITTNDIPGEEGGKADKRLEAIEYLLANGADPNTLDDDGQPILYLAIENSYNDPRVVMSLIEHGADTSNPDKKTGQTPFFQVVRHADKALLLSFLTGADGIDIEVTDPEGNTALHVYFKENSYFDISYIRATVALGVPLEPTNNEGKSVLDILNEKRNELEDEYAVGQLDEVIELISDESISSAHGILSRVASSPEELVSQGKAHVEIMESHESAGNLFLTAHEQGYDILPLLGEQLHSDDECWRKTSITVYGKIGLDPSSVQGLQERFASEWNDEIKDLIRATLSEGGFELPLDPTILTTLDVETARKVLALITEDDENLSLNSLTELSVEVAEVLIEVPCCLILDQLGIVSDDVIEVLARHPHPLSLDGLQFLSETAANSLAGHSCGLYLNGLSGLELPVAQMISQRSGVAGIVMGGIATVSEEVAIALASMEANVLLAGLTELDDSAGHLGLLTKLAAQDSDLQLNGLTSLTEDMATILATHKTGTLSLQGISTLPAELAIILTQHKGETLGLDGLTDISVETAKAFGSYEKNLWLDGLLDISPEAAIALAGKQMQLTFNGIAELPDDVAKALACHQGELLLDQILSISDEAAASIASHHGGLSMKNLENISNEAAEQLNNITDSLYLQLDYITPDSSAEILRNKVEAS